MFVINSKGEHEQVNTVPYWENPLNYAPKEVITPKVQPKGKQKMHQRSGVCYRAEPVFLDTETSHTADNSAAWIHQWAARWGAVYITGRDVNSLVTFLQNVSGYVKGMRSKKKKTLVYIHNLPYDWQYFKDFLPGQEVFATKPRKPLTVRWENLDIRCSYQLTHKALAMWARGTAHPKLIGKYDYNVIRYPWTPLTDMEWAYQLNDVAAMYDAWHRDRTNDGYTVADVPLTTTGFIRNIVRKVSHEHRWDNMVKGLTLDYEWYLAAQCAYQAGVTHGNPYLPFVANPQYYDTLNPMCQDVPYTIGHRDYKSSYPCRMVTCKYPMGAWHDFEGGLEDITKAWTDKYAMLIKLKITSLKIKNPLNPIPCVPYSKLLGNSKCELDNGRVRELLNGEIVYIVTDIDFWLMMDSYDIECELIGAKCSRKDYLPKEYREVVMYYFEQKETKKHSDPILYNLAKEVVNGLYGMGCQKTIQDKQVYDPFERRWIKEDPDSSDYDKAVEKLFIPFVWGLWTTAEAHKALLDDINVIGWKNYLYCDTDSIFYISTPEAERKIEKRTITILSWRSAWVRMLVTPIWVSLIWRMTALYMHLGNSMQSAMPFLTVQVCT